MSQDRSPREYWLNPNPDNRGWSEGKPDQWLCDLNPHGQPIHVIEYSAYEALQAKVQAYEKAIDEALRGGAKFLNDTSSKLSPLRIAWNKLARVRTQHREGK